MIKFKEFLREYSFIKEQPSDDYWRAITKVAKNNYRHSIGLPDEDEIPQDAKLELPTKGIQRSVEDEARRRMSIEDTLSIPVEPPFLLPNDTDTTRERNDKLTNRIIDSLSNTQLSAHDMFKVESDKQRRLRQTTDNIVNDRKAQLPNLAKEQEELIKAEKKLKQKRDIVGNLAGRLPHSVAKPKGPAKIVSYFKNLLDTEYNLISSDIFDNIEKQEDTPWSLSYGSSVGPYGGPETGKPNPEFEQTRTFTADPAVAVPQENKQGIRLGRVDYSRKNK